jgi:hypothetical protein
MRSWLLAASAIAVALTCRSASAQEDAPAGDEARKTDGNGDSKDEASDADKPSSAIDADARYKWLSSEIDRIEGPTERWQAGWTWGFAWLAAGEWSLTAAAPKPGLQQDSGVGAVIATLAFMNMAIQPNTMGDAHDSLAAIDGTSVIGKYDRVRHAEYLIKSTATEEAFWHSWIPFTLNTVVNVAANSVLIAGFHQELAGWLSMGAGELVTLVQIFSRPYSATHAWERYTKAYHPFAPSEIPPDEIDLLQKLHISFSAGPGGVGAMGTF